MEYIAAKTIVSGYTKENGWFGCNYNMNIYRGCSHGCIYCDSRSECYAIDRFDSVRVKENALEIIERELGSKRNKGVIGTGSMSDPYNPFEKGLQLTRGALEIIHKNGFGAAIATKSSMIERDIDVLKSIRKHSPVLCKITVTTCDDSLCSKIEPHAPVSSERFSAVARLSENGIYAGILLMPILPLITDTQNNISGIVRLAKESGARFIYPAFGMTLRDRQREYYYKKLDEIFPGIKQKYIRMFGNRYECLVPRSNELHRLFAKECERAGLCFNMPDIIRAYRNACGSRQISIFDDYSSDMTEKK